MTQQGSIDAQKFAQKYGLSSVEVITKIKNKEIKGFSKGFTWYIESAEEAGKLIPKAKHGGEETGSQISQNGATSDTPSIEPHQSSIAGLIAAMGWVLFICAFIVGLVLMPDSTYRDPEASEYLVSIFFILGGLFQAILLWGFSAVIKHLHEIAANTRAVAQR